MLVTSDYLTRTDRPTTINWFKAHFQNPAVGTVRADRHIGMQFERTPVADGRATAYNLS